MHAPLQAKCMHLYRGNACVIGAEMHALLGRKCGMKAHAKIEGKDIITL